MAMNRKTYIGALFMALIAMLALNSCSPTMTGAVRDDSSLTGVSKKLAPGSAYTGPKLRVGVVNFENKSTSKATKFGESAADILGTILQKTGRFIVIPQQDLAKIMDQQQLGASGSIDPSTAAKMGRILGLNAIVTGSITAYSEVVEGGDFLVYKRKERIARVTVDYRVVDTTTGFQIMADSGQGVYSKETKEVLGMGSETSYDADLRDGALRDALTKAMVNMLKQVESTEWTGRIASIQGGMVYINAGQKTGLKVGDVLVVQELGNEVMDPQTGLVLGRAPGKKIGELIITGFFGTGNDASVASIQSGSGFEVNDLVKMK